MPGRRVVVRCSGRVVGDFHPGRLTTAELALRRQGFVDRRWSMLRHEHATTVREVTRCVDHDGDSGDVLATSEADMVLGCWTADCLAVVLIGTVERLVVAHAGWRGLAQGVFDTAIDALAEPLERIVVGPAIGVCCYAFGAADRELVASGLGTSVEAISGATCDGRPALDLGAAVRLLASRHHVPVTSLGGCTGCEFPGYSHRRRGEPQRHVLAAWQEVPR